MAAFLARRQVLILRQAGRPGPSEVGAGDRLEGCDGARPVPAIGGLVPASSSGQWPYEGQGYRRSGHEATHGSGDPILQLERQAS